MICCLTVKSFCGMSLRTATVVIGWSNIVWAVIKATVFLSLLISDTVFAMSLVISVCLALSVMDLITSGLLIVGAEKSSHLYILPWLINSSAIIAFKFGLSIVYYSFVKNDTSSFDHILTFCIYFVIAECFWIAIYSSYNSIRQTSKEPSKSDPTVGSTKFHNTIVQ